MVRLHTCAIDHLQTGVVTAAVFNRFEQQLSLAGTGS